MTIRNYIDLVELAPYKNDPKVAAFKNILKGSNPDDGAHHKERLKEFLRYLKEQGFTTLGSGLYGAVFTHPSLDYVIKVFKNDPDYLKFVKFCLGQQHNPNIPKFRGKPMSIDGIHNMVRLEKLTTLSNEWLDATSILFQWADENNVNDVTWHHMTDEYDNDETYGPALDLIEDQDGLLETLYAIQELTGRHLDLHSGNFMMRGHTLVVMDPIG